MKTSEFDGQRVLHVDGAAHVHSGVVVGQSDDEHSVFVRADNRPPNELAWDFAVSRDLVPVLITNAAKLEPS